MGRCSNPDCGYPDTACALRTEDGKLCEKLGAIPVFPPTSHPTAAAAPSLARNLAKALAKTKVASEQRFWSGNALDAEEAGLLTMGRRPRLIVVAGKEEAGKTCLLSAQYIAIANGRAPGFGYRFCHSQSLRGWQKLGEAAFEWSGSPEEAAVPRTNHSSHREPSYLHLCFKPRLYGSSRHVGPQTTDLLLTDMPGEWFDKWSSSADYKNRLPFLKYAHIFWVIVDLQAFLTSRKARADARALLARVAEEAGPRPVALLLSKTDKLSTPIPDHLENPEAWGAYQSQIAQLLAAPWSSGPTRKIFALAALPAHPTEQCGKGVLDPLSWSMELDLSPPEPVPERTGDRYFSLFRERSPR